MQQYMLFDYETFSHCDIKKSGAYEYSKHPTTDLLCVAYRIGTRENMRNQPTQLLLPKDYRNKAIDCDFMRALADPGVQLVAHNAMFERVITENVVSRIKNLLGSQEVSTTDTRRWTCTAALARSYGLPGKLEHAAKALDLPHQKNMDGHRIMLKLSRPRTPTFDNPSERHGTLDEFKKLYDYCMDDVDAEVELWLSLPELPEKERRFWRMDQRINLRGFAVDRDLVKGALNCLSREVLALDQRVQILTKGEIDSVRQRDKALECVNLRGAKLKNLRAQTVSEYLASKPEVSEDVLQILRIRQSASKSSTAKYVAFKKRTESDGRVRDSTLFYGAHTGRQSGLGLQPQNLFKSILDSKAGDLDVALACTKNRDLTALRAFFDRPMDALASLLRSCIIAPEGSTLDVGDFATVEVRVLFWLAGHTKGLEALRSGQDLYVDLASRVYGESVESIESSLEAGERDGYLKRQLGKAGVLGAGFGMGIGGEKFVISAKQHGVEISKSLAAKTIRAYRNLHAPVPRFWDVIEAAACRAVQNPGKTYRHGHLTWAMQGQWLTCQLPIGRKLFYYQPKMEWKSSNGSSFLTLTYMGIDSTSKKFVRQKTWGGKLTENVVQAVSRDLLYEAMARLEKRGHKVVLPVHDEIVTERVITTAEDAIEGGEEMLKIMAEVPAWAEGLPIKVEGWSEPRYRK